MSSYTVRVELHRASDTDYENLHSAMEEAGFVRWIKGDNQRFRLPTAEYNLPNSSLGKEAVRDKAKAATNSVKPRPEPWILVTPTEGRIWSGLPLWH